MSRFKLALLLAGAVSVSACSNSTTNIPTQPSQPNYVTDSFDGSINRNGAATHPFSVSSAGVITATIQTVSDSSKRIGLSLGTWNGTACASHHCQRSGRGGDDRHRPGDCVRYVVRSGVRCGTWWIRSITRSG